MVLPNDGNCFKCGKPGHWAAHCELNDKAASPAEHFRRLDEIKRRFLDFEITADERTRLIVAENNLWHDKKTGAKAK